jgi:hypothetical protein
MRLDRLYREFLYVATCINQICIEELPRVTQTTPMVALLRQCYTCFVAGSLIVRLRGTS